MVGEGRGERDGNWQLGTHGTVALVSSLQAFFLLCGTRAYSSNIIVLFSASSLPVELSVTSYTPLRVSCYFARIHNTRVEDATGKLGRFYRRKEKKEEKKRKQKQENAAFSL